MGGVNSSVGGLSNNVFLSRLTSLQDVAVTDEDFWEGLLGSLDSPRAMAAAAEDLSAATDPLCARLVRNNCKSRNFAKLVIHAIRRLHRLGQEVGPGAQGGGEAPLPATAVLGEKRMMRRSTSVALWRTTSNALFLIRLFTRYFYTYYGSTMVVLMFGPQPEPARGGKEDAEPRLDSWKNPRPSDDVSRPFLWALCNILVNSVYPLQLYRDVLLTLLSLLRTVNFGCDDGKSHVEKHDIPLSYFAPWQTASATLLVSIDEGTFGVKDTTEALFYESLADSRGSPGLLFARLLQNYLYGREIFCGGNAEPKNSALCMGTTGDPGSLAAITSLYYRAAGAMNEGESGDADPGGAEESEWNGDDQATLVSVISEMSLDLLLLLMARSRG
eukprot:CAMPEP_0119125410 /NCGR_PEP_ID=MMETSP1310-20130426/4693_1 /TAXON_ID=464262 /ORGANISM="Genus nov. species nov., Strain RCC2339" /LENGTH=385 /DNA_ID=CAMNT_0007115473 /DNA_START=26 /DNA_END=1180 /DNA_ORIENTATION=-